MITVKRGPLPTGTTEPERDIDEVKMDLPASLNGLGQLSSHFFFI